jgi:hypothetical protein
MPKKANLSVLMSYLMFCFENYKAFFFYLEWLFTTNTLTHSVNKKKGFESEWLYDYNTLAYFENKNKKDTT